MCVALDNTNHSPDKQCSETRDDKSQTQEPLSSSHSIPIAHLAGQNPSKTTNRGNKRFRGYCRTTSASTACNYSLESDYSSWM